MHGIKKEEDDNSDNKGRMLVPSLPMRMAPWSTPVG